MEERASKHFYFIGNYLCLDFINTEVIAEGRPVNLLTDFDDFLSWLVEANVLDAPQVKEIVTTWGGRREAEKTVARALDFRAALRHMVERLVTGKSESYRFQARKRVVCPMESITVITIKNDESGFHGSSQNGIAGECLCL